MTQLKETLFAEGFRRSKKGNLWRNYDGVTVSIFTRKDETFGWCIADDDGPKFGKARYESEEEAIEGLYEYLEET